MKGLLIKDLKLMLGQKRFFVIVIGMGVMFMFTNEQPSMAVSYITMILTMFTLSTISYDEYENGMKFLMTLPIGRKTYVQEKYIFGFGLSLTACAVSTVLSVLIASARNVDFELVELLAVSGAMLVMSACILAVTLPMQIKFGAEKGRIAMFAAFVVIGLVIAAVVQLAEKMGENVVMAISSLSAEGMVLFVGVVLVLVLFASYFASVRIINKKEY